MGHKTDSNEPETKGHKDILFWYHTQMYTYRKYHLCDQKLLGSFTKGINTLLWWLPHSAVSRKLRMSSTVCCIRLDAFMFVFHFIINRPNSWNVHFHPILSSRYTSNRNILGHILFILLFVSFPLSSCQSPFVLCGS